MASTVSPEEAGKPYQVRIAKPEEYEQVLDVAMAAFIHDPAFLYFGSVKVQEMTENGLSDKKYAEERTFIRFLLNITVHLDGRVVVVVDPTQELEGDQEKILAAAFWHPPNKRVEIHYLRLLIRSGVISVLRAWGINGLLRIAFEWMDKAHGDTVSYYKKKAVKQSPDNSWYLMLVMTDPPFQNKGYMSMIMREAFAHDPDATYSLDSTTAHSRDRYSHHGFEILSAFKLGVGKVSSAGIPVGDGTPLDGVEIYTMVKVWGKGVLPKV